ncbi:SMI1/KNR4 family protein [Paenibacillus tundrae]|uniref:SMI1/KNR4 family protein n=1 Tax=Paenibacillus tundrae TaxID=528187 RepID=UPI0030CA8D64
MIQGELIYKTIDSLKKRLENNNLLELQLQEGYLTQATCTFNEPADESDLIEFQRKLGFELPNDYINFLKISNGCSLFDHPQHGGEAYLYKWQDIQEATYESSNEGYLKIAYIYQDNIVIDLKKYSEGSNNYLMVKGYIDNFDESRPFNMNFELWFDRFIISQGDKFWDWSVYTAENFYKLKG